MARQPAPRIDPRDPLLGRVKDFLEWLYKTVPGLESAVDEFTAAIASLEALRGEMVIAFVHSAQPSGSSATRHMYPGYSATFWASSNVMPWVIVPEDGELFNLVAKHIASTTADVDEITYTVLVCSGADPMVFTTTTLAVTVEAASSDPVRDTTNVITVSAGDMVGVQFTCSGAISNMPTSNNGGHWASLLYRRTV